jgi:hypothetical protein
MKTPRPAGSRRPPSRCSSALTHPTIGDATGVPVVAGRLEQPLTSSATTSGTQQPGRRASMTTVVNIGARGRPRRPGHRDGAGWRPADPDQSAYTATKQRLKPDGSLTADQSLGMARFRRVPAPRMWDAATDGTGTTSTSWMRMRMRMRMRERV